MKLLHTGDWHVGKGLRGVDRHDEHRAVLHEIISIAEHETVDLVIVAGDLFDSSAPPPAAEQLVYETLLGLSATGAEVAVIAGNHDHPGRLRAVGPLLALGRVHLVTEPTRPDEGGIRGFTAADGSDVRLAMLPFVSKRGIVRAEALMQQPAFELAQTYSDRIRRIIDALTADFGPDTVNLITAHAFVLGGEAGGGERAAHLVDEYAVTAPSFPPTAGYVALGHLHRPQRVPGGGRLHYSGSPLALDFGEVDQAKQVNVVTLEPGAPAQVEPVRL
ncbi:MAG: exonuclease SbcCD subunit D, partial [Desertimonas sp.]